VIGHLPCRWTSAYNSIAEEALFLPIVEITETYAMIQEERDTVVTPQQINEKIPLARYSDRGAKP
jgi:hypothetical protein